MGVLGSQHSLAVVAFVACSLTAGSVQAQTRAETGAWVDTRPFSRGHRAALGFIQGV